MIWHILKKDLKLLWGMTAGVAMLHFGRALAYYKIGHFEGNATLGQLLNLLIIAEYLASGFLIAMVVHQDAIPGVRQDWLVRPIRRRDLLLAKVLFTVILVLGPMVAADLVESLLFGFPFGASLSAALQRGFFLSFMALALVAFGALTKNLTQAIVVAMVVFLAIGSFIIVANAFAGPGRPPFVVDVSGLEWISEVERSLVCLVTAAVVLGLLYFRRKTKAAYWVFGSGVLFWLLTLMTPWRVAFALQEKASPQPGAAAAITVGFNPSAGPKHSELGSELRSLDSRTTNRFVEGATVALPLRITGLPKDVVLNADHYELRFRGADGRTIHQDYGDNLQLFHEGETDGSRALYQGLWIPQVLYQKIKDQRLDVELDYSFTLMRLEGSYSLPALDGDDRLQQLGWCKTRINVGQTAVQMRCVHPAKNVYCASAFLEDASTGARNPERQACQPHYTPYVNSIYDSLGRAGMSLAFRDPAGLAHYPVGGAELANARVVVRAYEPAEHFTRQLVISNVRLSDWNVP